MWYFAYGSNLNRRAVTDWARHHGLRPPSMKNGVPAVLDNYRLCFPVYSEYWGGGTADIVYDPGKYVAGVMFDLSEAEMHVLDQKVDRRLDAAQREVGVYKRIEVKVSPLKRMELTDAVTYQGVNPERWHIPPTQHYMDLVVQGAFSFGLSQMWIAYLQSFRIQPGRKPRPPAEDDAAPTL